MNGETSLSRTDTQPFTRLRGIQQLAENRQYKAWLLEELGVLLDGKQPYPDAVSTLEKLVKNGAKIVIISNSSRSSCVTIEKLKSLGFDPSLFVGVVTSGELTHQYLERRDDAWFAALGRSCIHMIGKDPDAISFEGLDLKVVENVEEAEFILAQGTEALGHPSGSAIPKEIDDLDEILKQCVARKLPMVVANPDYLTVEDGTVNFTAMAGTLGLRYKRLGGEVKWIGKPDKNLRVTMRMLNLDASDCIAVGDSLDRDIRGANVAGLQSAFITKQANELWPRHYGEAANLSYVEFIVTENGANPSYVLPAFTW